MSVLAVIPIHSGSKRFPGKFMSDLYSQEASGKPLVWWPWMAIRNCVNIDFAIVASDANRELEQTLITHGIKYVPLDEEFNCGFERVAYIASYLKPFDIILDIQGDEPLLTPEILSGFIKFMKEDDIDIGTIIAPLLEHDLGDINCVKAKVVDGEAIDFGRMVLKDCPPDFFAHIGVYGFKGKVLRELAKLERSEKEIERDLEQTRWLDNGYKIKVFEIIESLPSVNVLEDIDRVNERLRERCLMY